MLAASAAQLATKVLLTGILTLVPSAKNPHLIRVVAPNARVATDDEAAHQIPSHVTYVMFDMDDLVTSDPEVSRQPDYEVRGKDVNGIVVRKGVCLIKGEYLQVGPFSAPGGADVAQTFPKELLHCCTAADGKEIAIDPDVLSQTPDPDRVGLRLDLYHGVLGNENASIDPDSGTELKTSSTACTKLTRLLSVTMPTSGPAATLTIKSTPFTGSLRQLPLLLKRDAADGDLVVMIGNEPPPDLEKTIDFLIDPSRPQRSDHTMLSVLHQRILNHLTTDPDIFIPTRLVAAIETCVNGRITVTHPLPDGVAGKTDTCNPAGGYPQDPNNP
jgi:hypothetical protein